MTRTLSVRHLLAICVVAAAGTAGAPGGPTAAAAPQPKKASPPTELWNSYPLGKPLHAAKRPVRVAPVSTRVRTGTAPRNRAANGETLTNGKQLPKGLLASVFAAMLLGATAILLVRRSVPLRTGGGRRERKPPQKAALPAADDLLDALRPEPKLEYRRYAPVPVERPPAQPVDDARAMPFLSVASLPAKPERSDAPTLMRSELKLWRGFVECRLYAAVEGSSDAWAVSRPFRLRGGEPSAAAQQALSALLAELEDSGWDVVSSGSAWYERRLERSVHMPDGESAA
jgi:hypothetical protein